MLFLGSLKFYPNCIDIGPYSPNASYALLNVLALEETYLELLFSFI